MPVTALLSKDENYYTICIVQICTPCAFISVIELPRIPAYCPKLDVVHEAPKYPVELPISELNSNNPQS